MKHKILVWFRQDLRLSDNPALHQAGQEGTVVPVYIFDKDSKAVSALGSASRWWLHQSLEKLSEQLEGKLNFYSGNPEKIIGKIVKDLAITAVYFNRCYEPDHIAQDVAIKAHLEKMGIVCITFNGSLLWEPWQTLKKDGTPYKVFTPFFRNGCLNGPTPRQPLPAPSSLSLVKDTHADHAVKALKLIQEPERFDMLNEVWVCGEKEAQKKLKSFIKKGLQGYKEGRNFPSRPNVSRLSPHLHFGETSPHQIWHAVNNSSAQSDVPAADRANFLTEIAWREFSYSLLFYFPELPRKNFQEKFDGFAWHKNAAHLKAWQEGKTGYPIVDAGMRELLQTGYMHNRVRMIVGSFLVKNLLIHWHEGADWFWDNLVDADLASNTASWQWVAGSGADAAPYFRIFNPITQGEKFDKEGEYTLHFVPELKNLPKKYLFSPWTAPQEILHASGIVLGKTYPQPIVDISESRDLALSSYKKISNK